MNWKNVLHPLITEETATDTIIAESIRGWRNQQLAASDYTQLADVPLSNKSEWAAYRQELRDMMAQSEDPKLIVFPEPPSENA
jgi:hypothetical protein